MILVIYDHYLVCIEISRLNSKKSIFSSNRIRQRIVYSHENGNFSSIENAKRKNPLLVDQIRIYIIICESIRECRVFPIDKSRNWLALMARHKSSTDLLVMLPFAQKDTELHTDNRPPFVKFLVFFEVCICSRGVLSCASLSAS